MQVSSTVVLLQRRSCGVLDDDREVLLCTIKFEGVTDVRISCSRARSQMGFGIVSDIVDLYDV